MSSPSDRFKAVKRKCHWEDAVVDRFSGQQKLRKKRRTEYFEEQRTDVTSRDIDNLIEDVEMLDVSEKKVVIKNQWVELLWSQKFSENFTAVERASRFVRWQKERAIAYIIGSGLIPRLFELLFNVPALSIRESYLLSLFKKTTVELLVDASTLELGVDNVSSETITNLVNLLNSETEEDLKHNIILIVSNIASEFASFRNQFIQQGVIESLRLIIESTIHLKLLSNATWTLSNICLGWNPPSDDLTCSLCVPTLAKLIPHEDFEVMIDSCHALAYLVLGSKKHIKTIIATGVCPRLAKLAEPSNPQKVTLAALFALRKIVLGSDEEVQEVIQCGTLTVLKNLLQSTDELIVTQSCDVIANIAAGNSDAIQAVIESGAMHEILNLVQSGVRNVKFEAAMAIRQSISAQRTLPGQIAFLVSIDCIKILCQQLPSIEDTETLLIVMRALQTILDFKQKGHIEQFSSFCPISLLESFTSYDHPKIRKYSSKMLRHLE